MSSILAEINDFQTDLLSWFKDNQREMPWRAPWGAFSDPYHVWLSEIMLQQTTVVTVIPYFLKFIEKWPNIKSLSNSSEEEVLTAWAGLGYYARARNLHKCAKTIVCDFGGVFPRSEQELLSLPGVGPYTASAISSIAFNNQAVAVDGNVERVISRLFQIEEPLPDSKARIKELAYQVANENDYPSAFTQAMMELGATVCTPKKPSCGECPVKQGCLVSGGDAVEGYPRKKPKAAKPQRFARAYVIINETTGKFFVRKRADKGLLANMLEVPTSSWDEIEAAEHNFDAFPACLKGEMTELDKNIIHVFTHFKLTLKINIISAIFNCEDDIFKGGEWITFSEISDLPFPTLMKKVISHAKENSLYA